MKVQEIRLPKSTKDLRIKHWKPLHNPIYDENMNLELVCQFLSEFTGEHINSIREIDCNDVWRMYEHCLELYAGIHINAKPRQEITIGGEKFRLVDPHKDGSGWHIDFSKNNDIQKDPVKVACLFYYPAKATKYGEIDQNKNLKYPIRDRYNAVERDMTLEDFMSAAAFFLRKYEKSMSLSMASQEVTRKVSKLLGRMTGKSSLT